MPLVKDVKQSNRNIDDLHPTLQRAVKELIKRAADQGLPVLITETHRSSERQEWLYTQGRTRDGNIVTNVRTNGIHFYRVAFDFCRNVKGKEWDNSDGFYDKVGKIWVDMGGVWGGNWKGFVDNPHCEFTDGHPLDWFRRGNTLPDSAKMKWEIEKESNQL